jgi:hypothetical protein
LAQRCPEVPSAQVSEADLYFQEGDEEEDEEEEVIPLITEAPGPPGSMLPVMPLLKRKKEPGERSHPWKMVTFLPTLEEGNEAEG